MHERIAPDTAMLLTASSTAVSRDLPPDDIEEMRASTVRLTCLSSLAGLPAVVEPSVRIGVKPAGPCLAGADRALVSLLNGSESANVA